MGWNPRPGRRPDVGLVFVGPLLLRVSGGLQSVARYLAFGLIALPLAWLDARCASWAAPTGSRR